MTPADERNVPAAGDISHGRPDEPAGGRGAADER